MNRVDRIIFGALVAVGLGQLLLAAVLPSWLYLLYGVGLLGQAWFTRAQWKSEARARRFRNEISQARTGIIFDEANRLRDF